MCLVCCNIIWDNSAEFGLTGILRKSPPLPLLCPLPVLVRFPVLNGISWKSSFHSLRLYILLAKELLFTFLQFIICLWIVNHSPFFVHKFHNVLANLWNFRTSIPYKLPVFFQVLGDWKKNWSCGHLKLLMCWMNPACRMSPSILNHPVYKMNCELALHKSCISFQKIQSRHSHKMIT